MRKNDGLRDITLPEGNMSMPSDVIDVSCPHCSALLEVSVACIADGIECPACTNSFAIDMKSVLPASQNGWRSCCGCGARLELDSTFCVCCGTDQKTGKAIATEWIGSENASFGVCRNPYRIAAIIGGVVFAIVMIVFAFVCMMPYRRVANNNRSSLTINRNASSGAVTGGRITGSPMPWIVPQGATLAMPNISRASWGLTSVQAYKNSQSRDAEPPPMVLVRGDTVAYICQTQDQEELYINGQKVASIKGRARADRSGIVLSEDLQHWIAATVAPTTPRIGILLLDGKQFGPDIEGEYIWPEISSDGRFIVARVLSSKVKNAWFVHGTIKQDIIENNYMLWGPERVPVYQATPGWVVGKARATDVSLPVDNNWHSFRDNLFVIIGKHGNQHVWVNGVEQWVLNGGKRVEVTNIDPCYVSGMHPVSHVSLYQASRGHETYFVFDGRSQGPFQDHASYLISADGAHYAVTGRDLSGERRTTHDGNRIEYQNPAFPKEELRPDLYNGLVLSPSGKHVAEVMTVYGQETLFRDGVAVTAAKSVNKEFKAAISMPSFTMPDEDLVYLHLADNETTLRDGLGQTFSGASMRTYETPAGTVAYDVLSDGVRALVLNHRVVIRCGDKTRSFKDVFFSEDSMHAAGVVANATGGVVLVTETWTSAVYDEIETWNSLLRFRRDGSRFSDKSGAVFSPDGRRVAAVAHKGDDLLIVSDGKEWPTFKRADIGQGVRPRFTANSRVCYAEIADAKAGGEVLFVAEGRIEDKYQKRVSDVMTTPGGLFFYVLKGDAIHCVTYPKTGT